MRLLEVDEKRVYDAMMGMIKFKKLRCWNKTIPDGFISDFERDLIKT